MKNKKDINYNDLSIDNIKKELISGEFFIDFLFIFF